MWIILEVAAGILLANWASEKWFEYRLRRAYRRGLRRANPGSWRQYAAEIRDFFIGLLAVAVVIQIVFTLTS